MFTVYAINKEYGLKPNWAIDPITDKGFTTILRRPNKPTVKFTSVVGGLSKTGLPLKRFSVETIKD